MTYEEVKSTIIMTRIQFARCNGKTRFYEALSKALESVDKQIPKKLTHEATLYISSTCPTCKNVLDEFDEFAGQRVRITAAYCKYCGQALDWSDAK